MKVQVTIAGEGEHLPIDISDLLNWSGSVQMQAVASRIFDDGLRSKIPRPTEWRLAIRLKNEKTYKTSPKMELTKKELEQVVVFCWMRDDLFERLPVYQQENARGEVSTEVSNNSFSHYVDKKEKVNSYDKISTTASSYAPRRYSSYNSSNTHRRNETPSFPIENILSLSVFTAIALWVILADPLSKHDRDSKLNSSSDSLIATESRFNSDAKASTKIQNNWKRIKQLKEDYMDLIYQADEAIQDYHERKWKELNPPKGLIMRNKSKKYIRRYSKLKKEAGDIKKSLLKLGVPPPDIGEFPKFKMLY